MEEVVAVPSIEPSYSAQESTRWDPSSQRSSTSLLNYSPHSHGDKESHLETSDQRPTHYNSLQSQSPSVGPKGRTYGEYIRDVEIARRSGTPLSPEQLGTGYRILASFKEKEKRSGRKAERYADRAYQYGSSARKLEEALSTPPK